MFCTKWVSCSAVAVSKEKTQIKLFVPILSFTVYKLTTMIPTCRAPSQIQHTTHHPNSGYYNFIIFRVLMPLSLPQSIPVSVTQRHKAQLSSQWPVDLHQTAGGVFSSACRASVAEAVGLTGPRVWLTWSNVSSSTVQVHAVWLVCSWYTCSYSSGVAVVVVWWFSACCGVSGCGSVVLWCAMSSPVALLLPGPAQYIVTVFASAWFLLHAAISFTFDLSIFKLLCNMMLVKCLWSNWSFSCSVSHVNHKWC